MFLCKVRIGLNSGQRGVFTCFWLWEGEVLGTGGKSHEGLPSVLGILLKHGMDSPVEAALLETIHLDHYLKYIYRRYLDYMDNLNASWTSFITL